MKTEIVLENCIQRTNGLTLEQKQDGAYKVIPFSDLVPEEAKGKYGRFKVTVEFESAEELALPAQITINGTRYSLERRVWSFNEIVTLAKEQFASTSPCESFSVTYSSKENKASGILCPRDSIELTSGISITALITGNA